MAGGGRQPVHFTSHLTRFGATVRGPFGLHFSVKVPQWLSLSFVGLSLTILGRPQGLQGAIISQIMLFVFFELALFGPIRSLYAPATRSAGPAPSGAVRRRPAPRDGACGRHEALQPHSQHSLIITHDGGDCKTPLMGGGRHPVHFTATQHASELPFVDRLGFFLV